MNVARYRTTFLYCSMPSRIRISKIPLVFTEDVSKFKPCFEFVYLVSLSEISIISIPYECNGAVKPIIKRQNLKQSRFGVT